MKLKITILFFCASLAFFTSQASFFSKEANIDRNAPTYVNDDISKLINGNVNALVKMTPNEFEKMTGKKLTFKETLKLKAAQKFLKKQAKGDGQIDKIVYVLLTILGFGWVAMGIMDDWSGNKWLTNLLLTLLCGIPGLIHALVHMKDYYGGK